MKALMLGSGFFPPERKIVGGATEEPEWTTLDANPECKADIRFDLNLIASGTPIPLPAETFDEIHAYQVLEHFGHQGDYAGFFATFREFWRLLKPGGTFVGDTPALRSPWLWGDPGHTRVISAQTLTFLTRSAYAELGKTTSTDYRRYVDPCWWSILWASTIGPLPEGGQGETDRFGFVLKKVS
jgi:SAM-dependent methyltransferase